MTLAEYKDIISRSEYNQFTASFDFSAELPRSLGDTSGEAWFFCSQAYGDEQGLFTSGGPIMRQLAFDTELVNEYRELSDNGRTVVLGFETFFLHELTHNVDLLSTLTGWTFHTHLVLEYLMLRPALPNISKWSEFDLRGSLWRHADRLLPYSDDAVDLRKIQTWFASMRSLNAVDIKPGWRGRVGLARIFNRDFEPVTVLNDVSSIRVPHEHDVCLTHASILEARAVAHSLRHVLHCFREEPELARMEAMRYLDEYYPVKEARADYLFMLDVVAGGIHGLNSYRDVLAKAPPSVLHFEQVPTLVSILCWYALQGPDPIERLMIALVIFEKHAQQRKFENPGDILRMLLEKIPQYASSKVKDVPDMIEHVRKRNRVENPDEAIRAHFANVLAALHHQLRSSIDNNFVTPFGLPPNGNVAIGVFVDENAPSQITGQYDCGPEFRQWLQLREELLYRNRGSGDHKRVMIESYLDDVRASTAQN